MRKVKPRVEPYYLNLIELRKVFLDEIVDHAFQDEVAALYDNLISLRWAPSADRSRGL